jgi:hypothetical protein
VARCREKGKGMQVATGACTCVAICNAHTIQKQAGSVHAVFWLCGSAA